ncbi:hypothetical protein ACHAPJ_004106 [Fusarium lateritium]
MSPKTPLTITYKKPGTAPPIFLAGSFSDPQWEPQEMGYTTDQHGEHTFQANVMVEAGQDYQFKLRIGHGDWWVLAENYPTATDDSGNENNVISVPNNSTEEIAPAGIDTPAIKVDNDTQQTSTSAEADETEEDIGAPLLPHESLGDRPEKEIVEDTEVPLFAHESLDESTKDEDPEDTQAPLLAHESLGDDNKDETDDLKAPLFAHECLGAYGFGDDEDHDAAPIAGDSPGRHSIAKSKHDKVADIDVNDPTLEKFPSERGSILDAIRTIQTHLGEDHTHLDDIPSSPRVVSSRRTSLDSNDDMCLSPASLSPTATRRRESRPSYSGFGRSRSAVSLGSIEEEPKPSPDKQPQGPPVVSLPNPNSVSKTVGLKSPPSEEDEAVVMKTSEVKPNEKTNSVSSSQVESSEGQNTQHEEAPSAATTGETSGDATPQATDGKSVEDGSSASPASNSIPSLQDAQSTQDPNSQKRVKKTVPSGDSSRNPRGSVVPMIITTGALAVAIGIGWWQAADH